MLSGLATPNLENTNAVNYTEEENATFPFKKILYYPENLICQ